MLGQRIFGGYTITGLLGEGGMGAVYVAENEMLGKKLAVKVLHAQCSQNPHIVERFIAEARASTAIGHPNIVEVIDAAQLADGQHYIVLEYLEGQSLEEYARSHGPLATDVALAILVQAGAGLEAAHERGIVHRDVKPANVFVTSKPGQPMFVKVLDFGIAKLSPDLAGGIHTASHMVMGTPGYMSHEQARGSAHVDQRTDVYALAVIAYQILTERLPYDATSIGDLVAVQMSTPPPDTRVLRPDLPAAWATTIAGAMSIHPGQRPQSVRQLILELVDGLPGGRAVAQRACPLFFQVAPASEETVRGHVQAGSGRAAAPAVSTTLSHAVSEVEPAPQRVGSRRWRWLLGAAGLAAAGGVTLAFAVGGGGSRPGAGAARVGVPVDAAVQSVQPRIPVRIETVPAGASVRIGGLVYARTPVELQLTRDREVTMVVTLDGYQSVTRALTPDLPGETVRIPLVCNVDAGAPDKVTPPSASRTPHGKRAHHKTHASKQPVTGTSDDAGKAARPGDQTRQKSFDPNAPAGI